MNILILSAGPGSNDTRRGSDVIPPSSENLSSELIAERNGLLLLERLVAACSTLSSNLIFAVSASNAKAFNLPDIIRVLNSDAKLIILPRNTGGAVCTALLCIDHIKKDEELLILSANEFLDVSFDLPVSDFRRRGLDAGVVCFKSLHPRYSYVKLDSENLVVEASEKRPISKNAMAGFYWYARGGDFVSAAMKMIRKDVRVNDKFFVSLTLNELILDQKEVGVYEIPAALYTPLKSRRQIEYYESEGA